MPISQKSCTIPDGMIDLYQEIGSYERHFNGIQSEYRKLAAQLLIATFSAIWIVMASTIRLPHDILVCAIAVSASFGLLLLWNLDVNVYHRLLLSCFRAGKKLEVDYPELPRIREEMYLHRIDVHKGVDYFYITSIILILLTGIVLTLLLNYSFSCLSIAHGFLAIFFIFVIVGIFFMIKASTKTHSEASNGK